VGLFDFLSKKKAAEGKSEGAAKGKAPKPASSKEIARLERLVATKLSQNYDRQEAIEDLSRMGTAESAAALLKRFGWTMDPSITDHEEKESTVRGIAAAGEDALDPIRQYCRRAESLTWPLKALRQIVAQENLVDELLAILDQFDTEYVRNPEPKVQLIAALQEFPSEEVRIAVEPFLGDMSEPVRFTAADTVFSMDNEVSVVAFVAALEEEESLRVKNRIAQGLAEKKWTIVDELRDSVVRSLPSDFRLEGDRIRRR
jgi:HEAT repeat protein